MGRTLILAIAAVVGLAAQAVIAPDVAVAASPAGVPVVAGERTRVYVAHRPGSRGAAQAALAMSGAEIHHDFPALNALAVSLPTTAVQALARNPAIAFVEADPQRFLMGEVLPYGISRVQADQVAEGPGAYTSSVMACVIDSGVDYGHPDLPNAVLTGSDDPAPGAQTVGSWGIDEVGHGTHVIGTIAALGNNGQGVVGVAARGAIPIHVAKLSNTQGVWSSDLLERVSACEAAAEGRRLVVNMSLGGPGASEVEAAGFAAAQGRGVLVVASAGNGADSGYRYPASYDSVVSIAAVDQDGVVTVFSQRNDAVELAAPGWFTRSTAPRGRGSAPSVLAGGKAYDAAPLSWFGIEAASVSGNYVDCGSGLTRCRGARGNICLIAHSAANDLQIQSDNCRDNGGRAVVFYNDVDAPLYRTPATTLWGIPAAGIWKSAGDEIRAGIKSGISGTLTVGTGGDYRIASGTSMSAPHVVGIAALVWSHNPAWTHADIRAALAATAIDRGPAGRDNEYGFGIVQAKAALCALDPANGACGSSGGGDTGGGGGGGGSGPGGGKGKK
jgi:serine protease